MIKMMTKQTLQQVQKGCVDSKKIRKQHTYQYWVQEIE